MVASRVEIHAGPQWSCMSLAHAMTCRCSVPITSDTSLAQFAASQSQQFLRTWRCSNTLLAHLQHDNASTFAHMETRQHQVAIWCWQSVRLKNCLCRPLTCRCSVPSSPLQAHNLSTCHRATEPWRQQRPCLPSCSSSKLASWPTLRYNSTKPRNCDCEPCSTAGAASGLQPLGGWASEVRVTESESWQCTVQTM